MADPLRYRQMQRSILPEVGTLRTNSASTANQLAASFEDFGNTVAPIAGALSAERGAVQAEQESLLDKTPNPRTGLRALTSSGRAYNTAAEGLYVGKTQVDIDETLNRLETEHEANPGDYQLKVDKYREDLLKQVPGAYQARIRLLLEGRIAAGRSKLVNQEHEVQKSEQEAGYLASAPARIQHALQIQAEGSPDEGDMAIVAAKQDNDEQIDALVRDHVITPAQAEVYRQKFDRALENSIEQAVVDREAGKLMAITRADVSRGDKALADLENRTDLTEDEKNQIRSAAREQRGLMEYERSRVYAEDSAAFSKRVAKGDFGADAEAQARELYRKGAISVNEYQSYLSKIGNNEDAAVTKSAAQDALRLQLESGMGIDPTNKEQVKAVDQLFQDQMTQAGVKQGEERWQEAATSVMKRFNVLPPSVESWARRSVLNGDPAQAAVGAAFFERLHEANPAAYDYFKDTKLTSFASQLNENLKVNMDPIKAYELAHKNVYEQTPAVQQALEQRFRKDKVSIDSVDQLRADMEDDPRFGVRWFGMNTKVPDVAETTPAAVAMRADYDRLVWEYYQDNGGDADQAKALASATVRGAYGVTEINGKREVVKYPIESTYGLRPELVRADLEAKLKAAGIEDTAGIVLVPIGATDRTRGRMWGVKRLDEYGSHDAVLDARNQPIGYALPLGETYTQASEALRQKRLTKSRADRAEREAEDAVRAEAKKRWDAEFTKPALTGSELQDAIRNR